MSKKIAIEDPNGKSLESATSVLGRNVQKEIKIKTAEIKTEGIHR